MKKRRTMMNREELKEEINNQRPIFLEEAPKKVSGNKTYICPICGNGSGKDGTGISPYGENKYKCFTCGLHEDIIGLWQAQTKESDYNKALEQLCDYYHINGNNPPKNAEKISKKCGEKKQEDYTGFIEKCASDIENPAAVKYLERRKISITTAKRFKLGFDGKNIIIPTGPNSYNSRNIDPDAKQYRKGGKSVLFNADCLKGNRPVFITEGEFDALSIEESGFKGIGLGGVANWRQVTDRIKEQRPNKPLILYLDNDKAGQETTETLSNALKELKMPFILMKPLDRYKDANEALQANKAQLKASLGNAEKEAEDLQQASEAESEAQEEAERQEYLQTSAARCLDDFLGNIAESVNTPYIPTGFDDLDNIFDGGLYEGLYIIGAISSLGKTTFCLQMADNIAKQGHDVLIFSLEMARNELMSKSISRLTYTLNKRVHGKPGLPKTTRGITTGTRYKDYSDKEKELIRHAEIEYAATIADHIFIQEGMGEMGTQQIRETIEKHIRLTGRKPVVLVDYLQILAPDDRRSDTKQIIDKAVLELKRASRDFKIPVIAVSSFNRASYNTNVAMEAFKESGAIEYGSDVLIGLQFCRKTDEDINTLKAEEKRKIELIILKNRNGVTGKKIGFEYIAMFNYFEEKGIDAFSDHLDTVIPKF